MFSLIVKGKNLRFIKSCIVKTDLLNSFKSERTLITAKILHSNKIENQEFDVHEYFRSTTDPKNFGKIVSIDLDVVKTKTVKGKADKDKSTTQEKIKRRRKKKLENLDKRIKTQSKDSETIENSLETDKEVNENDKCESNKKKINYTNYEKEGNLLRLVMTNLKSKKMREKEGKIILEGKRIIHDAISAGFQPSIIFFSQISVVEKLNLSDNVKLCKVPYKTLQLWSDVVTSQGVVGVFNMPDLEQEREILGGIPLTVICDNIREPGNLGCILRLAAGIGCKKVILTKGCVDIFEPKVLRAAAGAHFCLSIVRSLGWQDIENKVAITDKIVLADTKKESLNNRETREEDEDKSSYLLKRKSSVCDNLPQVSYDSVNYSKENVVIVIGGETQGLSEDALLFAEQRQGVRVFIPMCNNTDSLNSAVALGILSYEVKRQMSAASKSETQEDSCNDESYQPVAFSPEPTFAIPML